MFTVIEDFFICALWGIISSLLLTGVLFYIPKAIHARYVYSPVYLLLLLMALVYFLFQTTLFTGAVKVKKYIIHAEQIAQSHYQVNPDNLSDSQSNPKNITKVLSAKYPMLEKYIHSAAETISTVPGVSDNPDAFISTLGKQIRTEVNFYIWRRTGWIVSGLLLFGFVLARNSSRQEKQQTPRRKNRYTTY